MPENKEEPRFSEEEFALILRRAIELVAGSAVVRHTPPPKMPPGGLTLSDIREIAVEVRISRGRIREAIDSLATPGRPSSAIISPSLLPLGWLVSLSGSCSRISAGAVAEAGASPKLPGPEDGSADLRLESP